jgi:hypothetical protein
MRIAPRDGLDDAGDFDRLRRLEDPGLAVVRASGGREQRNPGTNGYETCPLHDGEDSRLRTHLMNGAGIRPAMRSALRTDLPPSVLRPHL